MDELENAMARDCKVSLENTTEIQIQIENYKPNSFGQIRALQIIVRQYL